MDEVLVNNWNSKISPNDTVYFLGDFAFAHQERVKEILQQLNGNIYLCRGNHDKPLNSFHKWFVDVFDLRTISIDDPDAPNGKQPIVMCHYPLLTWDRQRYNSWMLHGHCHNNLVFDPKIRRLDVGVDGWNYSPISYQEIKDYFSDNFKG